MYTIITLCDKLPEDWDEPEEEDKQAGGGLTHDGWLQTEIDSSKIVPSAQTNSKSVKCSSVPKKSTHL